MLHLQALFHTTESLLTFPSKCMGNERAMFYPSADLIFLSLCFLGGSFFFQFHFVSGHHQKRDRTASVLSYSMGLRCMCYWYKEKKVVLALAPSFWVSFFLPGLSDWRNVERVYYYYRLLPFPFVSYIASFTLLFHVERAHKLTTLLSSMCSGK